MLKTKKILATILSLAVVFSAISGITSFAADEQATYGTEMNETFEGFTELPETMGVKSSYALGEIVHSAGNGANGSDYYLKCTQVSANYTTPIFWYALEEDKTYDISFDAMYPSTKDGTNANEAANWAGLQLRHFTNYSKAAGGYDNINIGTAKITAAFWNDNKDNWKHISTTFTASANCVGVALKLDDSKNCVFYLDNLVIKPHVEETFSVTPAIVGSEWNGTDALSATVTVTGYEAQKIRAFLALYNGNELVAVDCKSEANITNNVINLSTAALVGKTATRAALFVFDDKLVPLAVTPATISAQ